MYNFNEQEMKNFADDIKAKTILEMETKAVPSNIITGGNLAVEKADKQTKFKAWLNAKYNGDAMVVKAITGTYGSTLPTEFATDMWNNVNEYSLAKYCTNYKVGTGQFQVQTLSAKPTVVSTGVGAAGQGVSLTLAGITNTNKQIDINKYAAYQPFPKEMLDDNNYDLYGHLLKMFSEAVAAKQDEEIIAALNVVEANGGAMLVNSAGTDNLELSDFIDLYTKIETGAMKNAIFVMHRTTFGRILSLTTTATGIFTNANSLANPMLFGYPVILTEKAPSYVIDANSNNLAYFGDFANVGFASRQEMEAEILKEGTIGAVNLADTRQVALVVDARFGVKVVDNKGLAKLSS